MLNKKIYDLCMDIDRHKKYKWFVDENRQVVFFNIKVEELLGMKKDSISNINPNESVLPDDKAEILKIRIEDRIIRANTVKEFYRKIFEYLGNRIDIDGKFPYATGRKRYLVNRTKYHINGDMFVSPIKVGDYYIETHKSRSGALRDIYKYMKAIEIDVSYVE